VNNQAGNRPEFLPVNRLGSLLAIQQLNQLSSHHVNLLNNLSIFLAKFPHDSLMQFQVHNRAKNQVLILLFSLRVFLLCSHRSNPLVVRLGNHFVAQLLNRQDFLVSARQLSL